MILTIIGYILICVLLLRIVPIIFPILPLLMKNRGNPKKTFYEINKMFTSNRGTFFKGIIPIPINISYYIILILLLLLGYNIIYIFIIYIIFNNILTYYIKE